MPGIARRHFTYIVAVWSSQQSCGINFYFPCFTDKQPQAWRNSVTRGAGSDPGLSDIPVALALVPGHYKAHT